MQYQRGDSASALRQRDAHIPNPQISENRAMAPFLIIGGFVLLVGIVIFAVWYFEKRRAEALQGVADSLGFSFSRKRNEAMLASLAGFHLFSQGRGRKITNLMRGIANKIDVAIFDYKYTTGGGKNSHTWLQTVVLFQSTKLQLPDFALRPENLFHKIGGVFGYRDIDFHRHPSFSKQYLFRGSDEEAIRNVFSDELLEYYEQRKGLSTEAGGDRLVFYRSSKRVSPDKIRTLLEDAFGAFSLLKSTA